MTKVKSEVVRKSATTPLRSPFIIIKSDPILLAIKRNTKDKIGANNTGINMGLLIVSLTAK